MNMRKGVVLLFTVFIVGIVAFSGCAPKPQKDFIVIGASRPLTGPLSIFEQTAFGPIYKLWVKEVNDAGGIYVKEYDKKLPIKLLVYDDESDVTKMTKNLEKLIVEDKVDLLLPSAGTDMLFAAAPIANDLGYVLMGAEGGSSKLESLVAGLPYVYSVLGYSTHNQVPAFADMLVDLGVKNVAVVALSDLHGVEYLDAATKEFASRGINIVVNASIPVGVEDITPIIEEAKEANVDAFMVFAYPGENMVAVGQSIQNDFNPGLFLIGPGGNFQAIANALGPNMEGIMSWGAWNRKVSKTHNEFADKMAQEYGEEILDWWGHNVYYASLQFLQAAIEDIGTLNQEKLQQAFANNSYETILGKTHFDSKHRLDIEVYSGQVGQWQNGVFEVVAPANKATAKPVYPKPVWKK